MIFRPHNGLELPVARHRRVPLTFVAFDVLAFVGPVIDRPYSEGARCSTCSS